MRKLQEIITLNSLPITLSSAAFARVFNLQAYTNNQWKTDTPTEKVLGKTKPTQKRNNF